MSAHVFVKGPIAGDRNIPFVVRLAPGLNVAFGPVCFGHYRENAFEVRGERGRLSHVHGSLIATLCGVVESPVLSDCSEIEVGSGEIEPVTLGEALYELYTILADAVDNGASLVSPADSALRTAAVIDALMRSDDAGGVPMRCALGQVVQK